jgi:alpha-tubulin suppressor-like RCC1 family protein
MNLSWMGSLLLAGAVLGMVSVPVGAQTPGTVWGWGAEHGQLATGNTGGYRLSPVLPRVSPEITAVAAGVDHGLYLRRDRSLWAAGHSTYGQIGDGLTGNFVRDPPVPVPGMHEVIAVAAGALHSVALKADGTVWAWGRNADGQLGDGTASDRLLPVRVVGLPSVTAVSARGYSSFALTSSGDVWAWGNNDQGQLGDGSTIDRTVPVSVQGLSGVAKLVTSGASTFALTTGGAVWAWGSNSAWQLGDGSQDDRHLPVPCVQAPDVVDIGSAGSATLILRRDGTVWGWGVNQDGVLGSTPSSVVLQAVQVQGISGVTAITTAFAHCLALRADGTVWSWGWNAHGQLGDGTRVSRSTPIRIAGLDKVVSVYATGVNGFAISTRDVTAPQISMRRPEYYGTVRALLDVSGTAADDPLGTGVKRVTMRLRRHVDGSAISGKYWKPGTGWVTEPIYLSVTGTTGWRVTSTLPTGADLPDGRYVLMSGVYDNAGNPRGFSSPFVVDSQKPVSVTITSPASGASLTSLDAVTGTAFDNPGGSGINQVVVRIRRMNDPTTTADDQWWNGAAWTVAITDLAVEAINPQPGTWYDKWRVTAPLPVGDALLRGRYLFYAYAYDKARNYTSTAIAVTVP